MLCLDVYWSSFSGCSFTSILWQTPKSTVPFSLNTSVLQLLPPLLCMGLKRKLVYKLMSSQHFWVKVLASSSSFLCELCAVCNSLCNNTLFNCICGIGYRSVFVWTLRVQGTEPVTCSHSLKDFICVFWVGSNGLGWLHRGYVFALSILLCELWKAEM